MVKFAPKFCYCAVDQEKAVFSRKRTVSRPSALLGPEMVKLAQNFCYCAVDQEKAAIKRLRGNVPFRDFCYCAVDQANGRRKTLGNGPAKIRKRSEMVWERPENLQKRSGRGRKTLRNPGLEVGKLARKRSGRGLKA